MPRQPCHETLSGDAHMKKSTPVNMISSVRQRLLNISKTRKIDNQLILTRYGLERFLYRLSQSKHKNAFILRGN